MTEPGEKKYTKTKNKLNQEATARKGVTGEHESTSKQKREGDGKPVNDFGGEER